ncbi:hypothetical protein [Actinoplanes sp. TBRC 11911]
MRCHSTAAMRRRSAPAGKRTTGATPRWRNDREQRGTA